MGSDDYVHGYSGSEEARLRDQANTLAELLHHDTFFPAGSSVLEAGCGIGAQTVILAGKCHGAQFTCMDISASSLAAARDSIGRLGLSNVAFRLADIYHLPFEPDSFDHILVCFVLEHLRQPVEALQRLKVVLKPGGTITVIEGDHASAFYHPDSQEAQRAIDCLIKVQASLGGNSLIGRQLYPLIRRAGFRNVHVSPRQVYVDASRPAWVEGFTRNTFTAMVAGVKAQALDQGLVDLGTWERGIAALYATAGEDGTFSYTFFKGVALK